MGPIYWLWLQLFIQKSAWSFQFQEQSRNRKDAGLEPIKPCAGNVNFCEDPDDYPTAYNISDDVVATILVKAKIFDDKDSVVDNMLDVGRFGASSNDTFVKESRACDNRKSIVYPKKAKNVQGDFVFIVNDEQYRQAVDIEQCIGEGEACRTEGDAPSFGNTVCRQKYATYKMYVINQEGKQVYDSFSLPSACLCHHKSNFAIRNQLKSELGTPLPVCPAAEQLVIKKLDPLNSSLSDKKANIHVRKDSSVKFQERKRRQTGFVPLHCSSGNGETYCEDEDEDYPINSVMKALDKNNELSAELFQQLFDSQCKPLQTRGEFYIDEEQVCYGEPKIIFPRKAKNLDEKWRYVVNIDNYTQSVEIEECHNFNSEYQPGFAEEEDSVQFGEKKVAEDFGVCLYSGSEGNDPSLTSCKQIYTEHKLLALSEEGQLLVDSFKLPSACACFFREDYILEFRQDQRSEEFREVEVVPTLPSQVVQDQSEEQFVFG